MGCAVCLGVSPTPPLVTKVGSPRLTVAVSIPWSQLQLQPKTAILDHQTVANLGHKFSASSWGELSISSEGWSSVYHWGTPVGKGKAVWTRQMQLLSKSLPPFVSNTTVTLTPVFLGLWVFDFPDVLGIWEAARVGRWGSPGNWGVPLPCKFLKRQV